METDVIVRGWRAATIQNEKLRVTVLPGRGCDVIEFLYKPLDLDLTPRTHRGLRSKEHVESVPRTEGGSFVDGYGGGWQELLPSGGPATEYRGAVLPHHGESSRAPFQVSITVDTAERVEIVCTTRLAILPFRVEKRFALSSNSATLELSTTVVNETASPLPLMWGNHLAFGAPFIGRGSRITLSEGATFTADDDVVERDGRRTDGLPGTWPIAHRANGDTIDLGVLPDAGSGSDLHYIDPTAGWFRLSSADSSVEATVSWDLADFPRLWFWQEFGGSERYPWWGSDYLIGLEPWNCAPGAGLAVAVDRREVPFLDAGAERTAALNVHVEERQ